MSNRTYNQLWVKTQADIQNVLSTEGQVLMGKAEKDRELAYKAVSKLYLQYVKIFRTLDSCYDQMVHPQKRMLLRKLLDSTIGRILELKHDLVNLDNLEYSYHEGTMAELGYNPSEVELIVPKFVITDRTESINYWAEQMAEAKAKMKDTTQEAKEAPMSIEEAMQMLQKHERARQGRLRAKIMREIRRQEQAEKTKGKALSHISEAIAASKIQSLWKGAIARRKVRKAREAELIFIGMIPPPTYSKSYQNKLKEMEVSRRQVQIDNEVEYQKALVEIKDEIREKEGDEIVEKMKEECRDWFQEDKEETGKFPDYPSDDEGGSGAVFHPELQPDYEENQEAAINQSDKEESSSKKTKPGKEGNSSKDDKSGADKKGKEDSDDDGFKLTESEFVKGLKAADKTFVDVWLHKGIQFEGLPTKIPDTVQELNDKCFAQFGISHHILSYYLLRSYNQNA